MNFHPQLFPVSAGRAGTGVFTLAGQEINRLAEEFGTPLYLYDGETIRHQVLQLHALLDQYSQGAYEICYAAKAYFSLGIARHLRSLGLNADAASLGELTTARKAGFSADQVHLHGNNKLPEEITAALEWGAHSIVIDSLEELEFVEALAASLGKGQRIWLRISPGLAVDTHAAVQTAHHSTKFGLPVRDGQAKQAILRAKQSSSLHLTGLHTHLGSNLFDPVPYRQAVASLMALAEECNFLPEEISPGGGWGVPYLAGQPENPADPWIESVCDTLKTESARRGWPVPRLVIEPGRWLVARAGVAVYTVGTNKTSGDGTHYITIDGGMADNLRPALYGSHYTAVLAHCPDAEPAQKVSIAGKFCESGDVLIPEVYLPEVKRGDLLCVPASGAYQLSMASNYNLAPRPAVLWLEPGRVEVLQKREHLADSYWS